MLSEICAEFIRFVRDVCYLSALLIPGDRLVFFFALVMLIGVFLPWVSADGVITQTGLMGGGDLHMFLALYALFLVRKAAVLEAQSLRSARNFSLIPSRLKRISLNYIMIGVLSVLASIFVLLYCGSQYYAVHGIIVVRFGFYVTAFSGLFISFCGLERFRPMVKRNKTRAGKKRKEERAFLSVSN